MTITHKVQITTSDETVSKVLTTLNKISDMEAEVQEKGYLDRKIIIKFPENNPPTPEDVLALGVLIGQIETIALCK